MSDITKPKFDAHEDAQRLEAIARGMTYNGPAGEAQAKHILFEVAMRLQTGGYLPAADMAPSIHEMNYQAAMTAVESLRAENAELKARAANVPTLGHEQADTFDSFRDAVWEAVQLALGDAYDCQRVWSAWHIGTMHADDFIRVADQPDRVDEITSAMFGALPASVSKVHTWADMDAITEDPQVFEALQGFSADPSGDGGVVVVEAILNALGLKTFRDRVVTDLTSPPAPSADHPREIAPQPASSTMAKLTEEDEAEIHRLIDDLLDVEYIKLVQGSHVLHTSGPVTFDGLRALYIAGLDSGIKSALSHWPVLKGIGKVAGDGFKDTTKLGEVVYAWNQEKPEPYAPGQYPRVGNHCGWTAGTDQFDFTLASVAEIRSLFAAQEESWAKAAQRLVAWRNSMSYNDSYFGEPAGLVKQVAADLERLMPLRSLKSADVQEGGAA